jgi:hypothetical protein
MMVIPETYLMMFIPETCLAYFIYRRFLYNKC